MPTNFSALNVGGVPITGTPYHGGNVRFLDYVNGSDGNDGSAETPWKTLEFALAHASIRDGYGDVIAIKSGDSGTTYTQRLSDNLTISDDNVHIVGLGATPGISNRARISELSGVTIGANEALVTISGSNCTFEGLSFYQATDVANAACVQVTGSRNVFRGCHIAGITGPTAGADDGGCSLYLQGSENLFEDCTIGLSTIGRSAASAELRIARASASVGANRNIFRNCRFVTWATNAGHLYVQWATNGSTQTQSVNDTDDWTLFENCKFIGRLIGTGCATMTVAMNMSASINGVVFLEDCSFAGVSDIVTGDPSTRVFATRPATTQGGVAGLFTATATT